MQFSSGIVLAALAAIANAIQFDFDGSFAPEAGVPITLNWSGAEGPVTITLKNGASGDLKTVEVITSGQTSGSFTWTPDEDLPTDTYALEITDGTDTNYTPQFELEGDGVATTASASTSASATATVTATTATVVSTTGSASNTSMTMTTSVSNTTMSTSTTASSTSSDEETATETDAAATTTPVNQNGSQRLASSLALLVGAVAAFAIFN
ncbi:hypothetical protein MKZ38_009437 [Zalerion maritima]|uniref:Yeast cell wall synthesis Kre9/Knh1-like N-terminal domain-containing protein n=1 Tax=Zalerion maritima TaxID=339359 RepID=A0AAD5RGH1_9PEZI|nr:hypothetical protein MKZ38_009437 [Zalerion maritima]